MLVVGPYQAEHDDKCDSGNENGMVGVVFAQSNILPRYYFVVPKE